MGLSEFELKDYDNALIHLRRGNDLGFGGSAEAVGLAKYRLAILLNRAGEFKLATGYSLRRQTLARSQAKRKSHSVCRCCECHYFPSR